MGVFIRDDSPYYWIYLETTGRKERTGLRADAQTKDQQEENLRLATAIYHARLLDTAQRSVAQELTRESRSEIALALLPPEPDFARNTYLTAEEAAEYLRFRSLEALRKWARRYAVPKCRRGRALLFLRRDLDEAVGNFANGRRKRR